MWLVMKESGQFQKWECFRLCRSHPNIYLIPSFWLGPASEYCGQAPWPPLHCIQGRYSALTACSAGSGQPWAQPVGLPFSVVALEENQYGARNVNSLPGKIRAC